MACCSYCRVVGHRITHCNNHTIFSTWIELQTRYENTQPDLDNLLSFISTIQSNLFKAVAIRKAGCTLGNSREEMTRCIVEELRYNHQVIMARLTRGTPGSAGGGGLGLMRRLTPLIHTITPLIHTTTPLIHTTTPPFTSALTPTTTTPVSPIRRPPNPDDWITIRRPDSPVSPFMFLLDEVSYRYEQNRKVTLVERTGTDLSEEEMNQMECCICMEDHPMSDVVKTNCSHEFCVTCMMTSMSTKTTCPLCRTFIDVIDHHPKTKETIEKALFRVPPPPPTYAHSHHQFTFNMDQFNFNMDLFA